MRLNKFITDAGYCSRREADRYIEQGRVTVNGIDAKIGDMVAEGDIVEVDGERVGRSAKRPVYIILNKPVGVTCTTDTDDDSNVIDFVGYKERLFHVGRLDKDSEGLLILTNNGDIVNKILRAGNNHPKEYIVTVNRPITGDFISQMSKGVRILGEMTKPCKVVRKNDTTFIIYLTQGLNRQIRRMCQALGYKVVTLKRTKVMHLSLDGLELSRWRFMTAEEVREMHALLADSTGTEEASRQPKKEIDRSDVSEDSTEHKPRVVRSKKSSYSEYRKGKKSPYSKSSSKGGFRKDDTPNYSNASSPASKKHDKTASSTISKQPSKSAAPTTKKGRSSDGVNIDGMTVSSKNAAKIAASLGLKNKSKSSPKSSVYAKPEAGSNAGRGKSKSFGSHQSPRNGSSYSALKGVARKSGRSTKR